MGYGPGGFALDNLGPAGGQGPFLLATEGSLVLVPAARLGVIRWEKA